jgi:hypothetical protein
MNFQDAEKTYRDLKAQHDSGKLSDSTFEAEVGKLRMQDAQNRWWQIGVQTGEWYMHDGQKWNKAKRPAVTPDIPRFVRSSPVSKPSSSSRMSFEEAEIRFREIQARVQRGEPINRAQYEELVGQIAVQDGNGTLWEINPRTAKWMYFDGAEWQEGVPPGRVSKFVFPGSDLGNSSSLQPSETSVKPPRGAPASPRLPDMRDSPQSNTPSPSERTSSRFFLTHSWKDVEFASKLADDLRATGFDGFFDKYSLIPLQI